MRYTERELKNEIKNIRHMQIKAMPWQQFLLKGLPSI